VGSLRRAAFLDRDGTLNVRPPDHEYVTSADDFVWLPSAAEAMARLSSAGFLLAVVSNQRGVARGFVSPAVLDEIERRIQRDLAELGCRVDAFRYCFHDLDDACDCRKPRPGMLRDLGRELELDLARSWMIGDADSDVEAGRAAGCRTALVTTGTRAFGADLVAPSLDEASRMIAVQASSTARV
jgi:D-glycero-D-manno-heptose 1,7-bisphosphate phosphatase